MRGSERLEKLFGVVAQVEEPRRMERRVEGERIHVPRDQGAVEHVDDRRLARQADRLLSGAAHMHGEEAVVGLVDVQRIAEDVYARLARDLPQQRPFNEVRTGKDGLRLAGATLVSTPLRFGFVEVVNILSTIQSSPKSG